MPSRFFSFLKRVRSPGEYAIMGALQTIVEGGGGMAQQKPHRISIPHYSLSEELISSISHGVGALLGVAALVLGLIKAGGDAWKIVSMSVFGFSLIFLYTMSTLYHALKVNRAKRVFRVIDHCSIFLLIAGTYTPYTLVSLRDTVGCYLFGTILVAAIVCITLNAVNLKRSAIASDI